jgi:hypothetical protein
MVFSPSVSLRENQTQPLMHVKTARPRSACARGDWRRFESAVKVSDSVPLDDIGQTRKPPFRHRLVEQWVEVIQHLPFISVQNASPATAAVRPGYGLEIGKPGKPI